MYEVKKKMKTVEYINQFQSRLLRLGSRSEMVLLSTPTLCVFLPFFGLTTFASSLQHSEELSYTI